MLNKFNKNKKITNWSKLVTWLTTYHEWEEHITRERHLKLQRQITLELYLVKSEHQCYEFGYTLCMSYTLILVKSLLTFHWFHQEVIRSTYFGCVGRVEIYCSSQASFKEIIANVPSPLRIVSCIFLLQQNQQGIKLEKGVPTSK